MLGSGTVTILEVYRALLASNYTPIHDVEWHFYSAVSGSTSWSQRWGSENASSPFQEEGGLLGSQAVVKDYVARDAKIQSQLQVGPFVYQ